MKSTRATYIRPFIPIKFFIVFISSFRLFCCLDDQSTLRFNQGHKYYIREEIVKKTPFLHITKGLIVLTVLLVTPAIAQIKIAKLKYGGRGEWVCKKNAPPHPAKIFKQHSSINASAAANSRGDARRDPFSC